MKKSVQTLFGAFTLSGRFCFDATVPNEVINVDGACFLVVTPSVSFVVGKITYKPTIKLHVASSS